MSAILEIVEEVHSLPPDNQDQLREALNNDEFLGMLLGLLVVAGITDILSKMNALDVDEREQLRKMLGEESRTAEQSRRLALSRSIRGKYAHLNISSDDFAAQKAEEIALEDRHSGRSRRP